MGEKVDYLAELGVTYLHLMPLLKPRPGQSDGGYAVMDYRAVREDLGTVDDLRDLATTLRGRGHLAHPGPGAQPRRGRARAGPSLARAGDEYYRGYFHLFADRELPDAYEQTLPEVFPDSAPGNFTFDDES